LGGAAGSGEQFISWIHDVDFINAIDFIIKNESLSGAVNVASPNPLPNAEFMQALRDVWGRRFGLPASEWMIELGAIFLRTESELVLKSRRVVPARLVDAGFQFEFANWTDAARNLCERRKRRA
jgi:NAD dependent epimerase/dehydratase family enzyme